MSLFDFLNNNPEQDIAHIASESAIKPYDPNTLDIQSGVKPITDVNVLPDELKAKVEHASGGEAFKNMVGEVSSNPYNALYNLYNKFNNFDTNYNPFEDPLYKHQSDDFKTKYGNSFLTSPNADSTSKMIDDINKSNNDAIIYAHNPVANFLGAIVGGALDPTSLMYAFAPQAKAGLLVRSAIEAAEVGTLAGAQTAIEQTWNPTVQNSDILSNALVGAAMGGILRMAGDVAINKPSMDVFKKYVETGDIPPTPIGIKDNLDPNFIPTSNKVNYNYVTHPEDGQIAYTNSVFNFLEKHTTQLFPSDILSQARSPVANYLGEVLAGQTKYLNKNLRGIESELDISSSLKAAAFQQRANFDSLLEPAYKNYKENMKKQGLKEQTFSDWLHMAEWNAGGIKQAMKPEYVEGGKAFRAFYDDYLKKDRELGLLDENVKSDPQYIHHAIDLDKVGEDYVGFRKLVEAKIRPHLEQELRIKNEQRENPLDEIDLDINAKLSSKATQIIDGIKNDILDSRWSDGIKLGTISKSLEGRTLNFTNEEIAPFLKTDVHSKINNYIRTREFDRLIATKLSSEQFRKIQTGITEDVAKISEGELKPTPMNFSQWIDRVNEDYTKERAVLTDPKLIKKSEQEQKEVGDMLVKTYKVLTKQYDKGDSWFHKQSVKNTATVMTRMQSWVLLGSNLFMQLADAARPFMYKMISNLELKPHLEEIGKIATGLSKEDARRLGVEADRVLAARYSNNIYDVVESNIGGKTSRVMDWVDDKFYKYTGIEPLAEIMRGITSQAVMENIINWSRIIRKRGELEPGSFSANEFARLGLNKRDAERILANHEKYATKVKKWNGEVEQHNIGDWDEDIAFKLGAVINRETRRLIIHSDVGSKPIWTNSAVGAAIGQFKGFTFANYTKGLLGNLQGLGLGGRYQQLFAAMFVGHMLVGALQGIAKDVASGEDTDKILETLGERVVYYAFDRGGFFPVLDMADNVADKYGFGLGSALGLQNVSKFRETNMLDPYLGPSFGYLGGTLPNAVRALSNGLATPEQKHAFMKAVPFNNMIGIAYLLNQTDWGYKKKYPKS